MCKDCKAAELVKPKEPCQKMGSQKQERKGSATCCASMTRKEEKKRRETKEKNKGENEGRTT